MKKRLGFTLLELLLVIAIIAILASILIIAINPSKQMADARNTQRRSDINAILNSIYQYSVDNNALPAGIPTSTTCDTATNEVCKEGGTCTGLVDLGVISTNQKYMVAIPTDPTGASTNGSGYFVAKSSNNRITVCAPSAENSQTIEAIR